MNGFSSNLQIAIQQALAPAVAPAVVPASTSPYAVLPAAPLPVQANGTSATTATTTATTQTLLPAGSTSAIQPASAAGAASTNINILGYSIPRLYAEIGGAALAVLIVALLKRK